jgi:hypothetical protein
MTALEPYIGTIRPPLANAAWVIIPLVVYLYQRFILQQSAERLFLEPLNDSGQPSWPFKLGTRNLRRRIDAAMVAHWSVMLFGPALDGLFWIILKGSEGNRSTVHSKLHLLVRLTIIAQWYLAFGTRDPNNWMGRNEKWLFYCILVFFFAGVTYELYADGLTLDVCQRNLALLLEVVATRSIVPYVISIIKRKT